MKRCLFTLATILLLFVFQGCNNYGKEKTYNGVELYHTKNITEAEAEQLGNYLVSSKFADGTTKTVQLTKSGSTYQFRFVVKDEATKDTGLYKTLKFFASVLSSQVFNGAHVEVHMCDNVLKTLKVFPSDDYGKQKVFDGVQLFHTKNITDAEVDSLGNFLVSSKFANGNEKTVQIRKAGDTYQFRFVVKKGIDKDTTYLQNAKIFASDLSAKVFHNAPVQIHMCDEYLNTLAVVPMK